MDASCWPATASSLWAGWLCPAVGAWMQAVQIPSAPVCDDSGCAAAGMAASQAEELSVPAAGNKAEIPGRVADVWEG